MKTKLFGVAHSPENLELTLKTIDKEIAAIKGGKVKVGVEATKETLKDSPFWIEVVNHLKKNDRVEIVYLDSPTGFRIAARKFSVFYGKPPSMAEVERQMDKDQKRREYVRSFLRHKRIARRLAKKQPDFAVVGAGHAFIAGRILKIKPRYIGCTEAHVREGERASSVYIKDLLVERRQRRRERTKTFVRKTKK